MRVSVIVPTLRRPDDLLRCLDALAGQWVPADEVIVIVRYDDYATLDRLDAWQRSHALAGLKRVTTEVPGVVAAYNLGADTATGDVICFTDDDAAPHRDWIERIQRAFAADSTIGGLGGRDLIYQHGKAIQGTKRQVGTINWFGRMVGNHHVGGGPARDVAVLKGVNMCWRRLAIEGIRFDHRLRGSGAQVHCEVAFSLAVARRGWRLVYDPFLLVDHFHAPRFDEDQRDRFNELAFFNAVFNFTLVMVETLPPFRRWAYLRYATWIGSRDGPGWLRALKLWADGDGFDRALRKLKVTHRAIRAARTAAVAGTTVNAPELRP